MAVVGLGVFRYLQVAAAAREGARYASVHGGQWASEQNSGTLTTPTDVYNNAILPHAVGLDTSQLTYSVTWADTTTKSMTGTLTSGSPTVTGLSSTTGLFAGDSVTGTGIAAGTTIASVDSSSQITLSQKATASGSPSLTTSVLSEQPTYTVTSGGNTLTYTNIVTVTVTYNWIPETSFAPFAYLPTRTLSSTSQVGMSY
jgi:hypothetical protein